jgi:hypothetical protein
MQSRTEITGLKAKELKRFVRAQTKVANTRSQDS